MTMHTYSYICPGGCGGSSKDGELCEDCKKWFPKPADCTCAYDAGWIYEDPKCPVHEGMSFYKIYRP